MLVDKRIVDGLLTLLREEFENSWDESKHPRNSHGQFISKAQEIQNKIEKILQGKTEEELVKNIRNDLEQYGGTNDLALIKGTAKGGILHINTKHSTSNINKIILAILKGKVVKSVQSRKVLLEYNNYQALLSLDYYGDKKTWLLTGYKLD